MKRIVFNASVYAALTYFVIQTTLLAQTPSMPCESSVKQVLLVVDVSGSMETNERLSEVKQFALRTVKERTKENLLYKLVSYGGSCNDVLTDVEWTRDAAVISSGIKGLYMRGGTPLGSALEFSIDAIKKSAYPDQTQVLMMNDGANGCGEVREILQRRLKEIPCVKISVVGIELEDDENNLADRAKSDAEAISVQTGGRFFALSDVRELRGISTSDTGVTVRTVAFEPRKKSPKAALLQVAPTTSATVAAAPASQTQTSQSNTSPEPTPQQASGTTTRSGSSEEQKSSSEQSAKQLEKQPEQTLRENKPEQQNTQIQAQEVKTQETKTQESKTQESKTQETKPQETKPQESKTQESKTQESKTQESKTQESKTQESKTQESKTQESKTQESKTQESKPAEATQLQQSSSQSSQNQPSQEKITQEKPSQQRTEEPQKATTSQSETPTQAPPAQETSNTAPNSTSTKEPSTTSTPLVKEEPRKEDLTPITSLPQTSNEAALTQTNKTGMSKQTEQEGIIIFFMPNSSALLPEMRKGLERLVERLRRTPSKKIVIDGHSSLEGSPAANLRLSVQRASSVAEYLRSQLVLNPQTVLWNAFGELRPIAENTNIAGQQENRRVEVRVVR
jgi:outer membrane protein OmpA-like peptidoglycan-associated protein/Mg-chelatase subunit ChlD